MSALIYFLKNVYPFIIVVNLALLIFYAAKVKSHVNQILNKISPAAYIFLIFILLLNLILIVRFSPLYDPDYSNGWEYKLSGKMLLFKAQYASCFPYCINKEVPVHPVGYPIIISLVIFLFGTNSAVV